MQAAAFLAVFLVFAACTGASSPETPSPIINPTVVETPPAVTQARQTTSTAPVPTSTPIATSTATPTTIPTPTATPAGQALGPAPAPSEDRQPPVDIVLPNVADTVEMVRPAVVSVLATVVNQGFFGPTESSSSGTGMIIAPEGLVLTSNHVIEGATALTLTLDDGRQLQSELVGTDRLSDLAVLRLPSGDYPYLPVGNDFKPRVGEWVIAIGNALALPGGPTVTVGVVSALGRSRDNIGGTTLNDLIQTDTVINPGNSGGPLINMNGDLVGINTAVLRAGYGRSAPIEGIGFAIDMETAAEVSSQLIELGRVRWAYMGVSLDDLSAEAAALAGLPFRQGAVVVAVGPGTPAFEAGIRPGDIVLSIDGKETGSVRALLMLLRQELKPGQAVVLELFRSGGTLHLEMVLGERPPV